MTRSSDKSALRRVRYFHRIMTEPIEIECSFSESEYVSAVRFLYSYVYRTTFILFLSGAFALLGFAILWASRAENAFGLVLTTLSLTFFVSRYRSHFISPGQYFRSNPSVGEPFKVVLNDDFLEVTTSNSQSLIKWSFFRQVLESRDFYFLLDGGYQPLIIPKRTFDDESEESDFRDLVSRKIGTTIKKNNLFERVE